MAPHLLRVRWCPIVCPPSGALCSGQKGCIPGAVHILLPTLTYHRWYTRLHVVRLVSQGPRGLSDTSPSALYATQSVVLEVSKVIQGGQGTVSSD